MNIQSGADQLFSKDLGSLAGAVEHKATEKASDMSEQEQEIQRLTHALGAIKALIERDKFFAMDTPLSDIRTQERYKKYRRVIEELAKDFASRPMGTVNDLYWEISGHKQFLENLDKMEKDRKQQNPPP